MNIIMNRNQGKFWARRKGAAMERKGGISTSMTKGFYVDNYDLFRISEAGSKPAYEAFIFPPDMPGEEWEMIIINHSADPVPESFRNDIDDLAFTLRANVFTYTELCDGPPKAEGENT